MESHTGVVLKVLGKEGIYFGKKDPNQKGNRLVAIFGRSILNSLHKKNGSPSAPKKTAPDVRSQ